MEVFVEGNGFRHEAGMTQICHAPTMRFDMDKIHGSCYDLRGKDDDILARKIQPTTPRSDLFERTNVSNLLHCRSSEKSAKR
jgi:hypothetical protein